MIIRILICLVVTIAYSLQLKGQDSPEDKNYTDIGLYGDIGYNIADFEEINKKFSALNYTRISDRVMSFSLGLNLRFPGKRAFYTFEFGGIRSSEQSSSSVTALRSLNNRISVNYDIIRKPKYRIYPGIGLGWIYTTLILYIDNDSIYTVQDGFISLKNQKIINTEDLLMDIGFGAKFNTCFFTKKNNCPDNFFIGLRTGYYIPVINTKWKLNDINGLPDNMKINPGGIYLKLTLDFF